MSRENNKYDSPFDKAAKHIGFTMTIVAHCLLLFVGFGAGLKYTYPPQKEKGIVIDFIEEEKPINVKSGVQPQALKAEPEKDIRLVQKSEAPVRSHSENRGEESTISDNGDVAVPEPPREKPINKRALFSSAKNRGDTTSQQTANTISNRLKAGHAEGNTAIGTIEGAPSAKLQGRNVVGSLPEPDYKVEKGGKVVVKIMVDQYGTVTNAIPGIKGTTVQDATLWRAAKEAALKAKFNISSSAPVVQEGSITYIFNLE